MNWIAYGLICIVIGAWKVTRARTRPDHRHVCPKCGAQWQHRHGTEWPTARAAVDAHTCPACGAEQFEIDARVAPVAKTPLTTSGAAPQSTAGGSGAAGSAGGLGRERPAPSPKDRDMADHGAGPALPPKGDA